MAGAQYGMCELTARHGMGTAWARHAMWKSVLRELPEKEQTSRYGLPGRR